MFAAAGLLAGAGRLALTYWLRGEPRNILVFLVATGPVVALFGRWAWLAWARCGPRQFHLDDAHEPSVVALPERRFHRHASVWGRA
ncbi:MAG: hypothetical protein WKG07_12275 [Hymenobacter sp.]